MLGQRRHDGAMELLEEMAPNLTAVLRRDAWWMTWNSLLAWIPVALAFGLFRRDPRRPRSALWWVGVALFVLFLPNAPYVVTDLIHLGDDVRMVPGDWPVVTAVLPVYGVFIGSGFLAYYLSLDQLSRYLDRRGQGTWRGVVFVGIHALCAVGVYLGRHARLNSWEPVVEPHGTLERIVLTLSWRWAPLFVLATFVVTWAGHFVTKAVAEAVWLATSRMARTLLGHSVPAEGPS
jgi:uncharacterized membrane protein